MSHEPPELHPYAHGRRPRRFRARYVLDFSDRTFAQFFAIELDVDINLPEYATAGGSKGKRLRRFLALADDPTAARTLRALWEHRLHHLDRTGDKDPIANAESKYRALLATLGGTAHARPPESPKLTLDHVKMTALKGEVIELTKLPPHRRGYAYEIFLVSLFDLFGMRPREPFRNKGEQIDGSFVLNGETYLFEAKWQNELVGNAELHAFEGKLSQKAAWARGLFISHNGFSEQGLHAFGRGKRTICMTGLDLYEMLDRGIPLDQVIDRKVRRAAEDGQPHTPVPMLF